jgi:hypothetical protein
VRGAPAPFDGLAEVYTTTVEPDADVAATVRAAVAADTDSFIDRAASPNCFGRVDVIIDR